MSDTTNLRIPRETLAQIKDLAKADFRSPPKYVAKLIDDIYRRKFGDQ